jgi:RHS repeat-associated protein
MDSLHYEYYANTNRLRRIRDSVPANGFVDQNNRILDIDGQADNNYGYDAIGNLVRDDAEHITNIKWNVYGKIQEITKNVSGAITTIKYTYDASGNRISQTVISPSDDPMYTWYVRDAQGNIMSTYKAKGDASDLEDLTLMQSEKFLYGSSRLGLVTVDDADIDNNGPGSMQYYYGVKGYERGYKQYELTNHLGNVLATISDRKFGISSGGSSLISYYEPHIVTAQDYYPFGMMSRVSLPNSGKTYKFGFNGKMNDDEVKGLGNQQDYGMRISDPRIGRFLSVDPLTKGYPELTPYQFASNSPIAGIDLDGGELKLVTDWLADKAKANGQPTLSGFIRNFGGLDIEAQQNALVHNAVKGDWNAVANQVAGYTTLGMEINLAKTAKKAVIDNDQEAYGELYSFVVQGAFGELMSTRRPAAPKVLEEPVTATKNQATAASGNAGAAKANTFNVKKPFSNGYQGMEFLDDNLRMVEQPLGISLKLSVKSVMGSDYLAKGEVTSKINNGDVLNVLNKASGGDWVKVYEAGIPNGQKIETHYFRNNTTMQVFDVKLKYNEWHQKAFKKIR